MLGSRVRCRGILGLLLCLAAWPSHAADRLIPLDVALGDVSLNKVPFLSAEWERRQVEKHLGRKL